MRERKNISQAELARRIEVSRQALSAVEANKQEPSLPVALKIARVLDLPLQQIFFSGDDDMESVRTAALTKVERLLLVNQFRLLQAANKDDDHLSRHYRRLEEIFERGYVRLYSEAFSDLSDEVLPEISEEVLSILDMHRAMLWSLGEKPDPQYLEKVKFQGFDANNEGEHLGFAKFFQQHPDRPKYEELRIVNSHHSTLPRYRKMLTEWQRMGREPRLTRTQIDSILEAGTFRH
jgi:uncharacterized protein YfbU (UPF0304 family)